MDLSTCTTQDISQTHQSKSQYGKKLYVDCCNKACSASKKTHIRTDHFKVRHANCEEFKTRCKCLICVGQSKTIPRTNQAKETLKYKEASFSTQSQSFTDCKKATNSEFDGISLKMPDKLGQQIEECIAKYNGTEDASQG